MDANQFPHMTQATLPNTYSSPKPTFVPTFTLVGHVGYSGLDSNLPTYSKNYERVNRLT